jgi:hypothetical protein
MQQKQAVIQAVLARLPGFQVTKDIALVHLTNTQLEDVKKEIASGISSGLIEYGKDKDNLAEVLPYARSMVMNHLKKAKELNGNQVYGSAGGCVDPTVKHIKSDGIDRSLLSNELKDFIDNNLV